MGLIDWARGRLLKTHGSISFEPAPGFKWLDFSSREEPEVAKPDFAQAVKLIHTRDLAGLPRMPRCQDHAGITLAAYFEGRKRLQALRSKCDALLSARRWLREHDHDDLVEGETFYLEVPRSFLHGQLAIAIPPSQFEEAVPQSAEGPCVDGRLMAQAGWSKRTATVTYRSPSRIVNRSGIEERAQRLAQASPEELTELEQIDASPFRAPLLFISHRWQSPDHPDPDGENLRRLRGIGDAFLVFDYSSFPQAPMNGEDAGKFQLILANMDQVMRNVVVLPHAEYLQRGWCVYEYLSACLTGSLVCDELADHRFARLLRWVRTHPPPPQNPFHDGLESGFDNFIQKSILEAVNALLPVFQVASYGVPSDRAIVRGLLRDLLKRTLPKKRDHDPHIGESRNESWTDEELEGAFESELKASSHLTIETEAFEVDVPASLEVAVQRGFSVDVKESASYRLHSSLSPFGALSRALSTSLKEEDFKTLVD